MAISIRQVGPCFAGEVDGLDLGKPLDQDEIAAIHAGMDRYAVLVFREQRIDDAQQLAFALRFGDPYIHPIARATGTTAAGCEHIVDDAEHPPFQDRWHTDVSWDVTAHRGKLATLVFVDDATTADGHLVVDDVWIWDH